MAVYPAAVNMLIPRGTIGGAGQQPIIKPTIIILHTNASNTSLAGAASLMKNTTKGQEYHFQQEASGTGRVAGRLGQYVDTTIRADNNYKANSFTVNGVLCGAISVETADHGSPYEKSWTDLGQRQNLEDLVVWLCRTHNIPARRCPNPYAPGIGYHSMWGYNTSSNPDVNPWTNAVGKICPGPGKIREFDDLLAAVARRVSEGDIEEEPVTDAEIAKIAKAVTDEIISGPAGGLGPATMEQTLFEMRTFIRGVRDDVDTLEESMLVLNGKLDHITEALAAAGSPDAAVIANAVRVQLDNTKLGPLDG